MIQGIQMNRQLYSKIVRWKKKIMSSPVVLFFGIIGCGLGVLLFVHKDIIAITKVIVQWFRH